MSLDGFLAGENDELDWLGDPDPTATADDDALEFKDILTRSGAMVMGRRTYDVVRGFGAWPYGDLPVLVATSRPLDEGSPSSVQAIRGSIDQICTQAQVIAGEQDVYLDGGGIITQALDADVVDELILTIVPVFLGQGIAVYQGTARQRFAIAGSGRYGAMMQLILRRA